jgi:hypothetical protein
VLQAQLGLPCMVPALPLGILTFPHFFSVHFSINECLSPFIQTPCMLGVTSLASLLVNGQRHQAGIQQSSVLEPGHRMAKGKA